MDYLNYNNIANFVSSFGPTLSIGFALLRYLYDQFNQTKKTASLLHIELEYIWAMFIKIAIEEQSSFADSLLISDQFLINLNNISNILKLDYAQINCGVTLYNNYNYSKKIKDEYFRRHIDSFNVNNKPPSYGLDKVYNYGTIDDKEQLFKMLKNIAKESTADSRNITELVMKLKAYKEKKFLFIF